MKKSIINLIVVLAITLSVSLAFAWGDKKEKIKFMSKDLHTYGDILDGLDNDKDVEIYGILTIPKKTEGKIPAMIYMHGSGGGFTDSAKKRIGPWLKMFNKMGIATFKLDSFKGRGVKSTVNNQRAVTSADMVVDVYRALELLSKHPRIDSSRIGIIGGSKGGGVALYSSWKPVRDAISTESQLALHVAIYGLCAEFEKFEFTGAPLLALVGEKDDWTPAEPWIPFVKKLKDRGYDAELVVYEGAYHGFDAHYPAQRYTKAYSSKDCRFLFKADGEIIETTTGLSADGEEGIKACRSKTPGVMIGQNMKAKKASKEKTKEFVTKVFKLNEKVSSNDSKKKVKTASTSSGFNSFDR